MFESRRHPATHFLILMPVDLASEPSGCSASFAAAESFFSRLSPARSLADDEESSSLRERLLKSERDNRYLRKDSDDRKVMEEVFDQATLLALRELMSKGELSELNGVVSAGKEARFYYGAAGKGFPASYLGCGT